MCQQDSTAGETGHPVSPGTSENPGATSARRQTGPGSGSCAPSPLPATLGCQRVRSKDQQQHLGLSKMQMLRSHSTPQNQNPHFNHGTHTHIQVWEELGWVVCFLTPRKDYALQAVNAPLTGVKRKETVPKKEDTVSHRNKPRG